MRIVAFVAAAVLTILARSVLADPQAPAGSPQGSPGSAAKPDDEIIRSMTPERFATILQELGYRARVETFGQNKNHKDVVTGMGGYKVAVYFFACDGSFNCKSIQFEAPFEKDPSFTLSRINSYNARQRFSRLYINPDDGSLALDYDLLVGGVTVGAIKESVALFDNVVGDFRKFVDQ